MVFGRMIVAGLIAACVTGLLIVLWGGVLFSLHPHWVVHVTFMLAALALHFFVAYQAYYFVKRKWF